MVLTYIVSTLLFLPIVLYFYFTRTFNYWKNKNVKGPKPVPIFGNLKESALRREPFSTVYKDIYENYPEEKIVGIYRMTTPCLLIRDLDIMKHVMIKDFDAFSDRGIEFSKEGLGINLFHADAESWKILRTQFNPIFTPGKLKKMVHLMTECGDKFLENIRPICETKTEHEIHIFVQNYTLSVITSCAFGINIEELDEKVKTLKFIDDNVLTGNFFNELDMMYPGILKFFSTSLFPAMVHNFFYDLVKNIFTQRNNKPSNRNDFMDVLLELKHKGELQSKDRDVRGKGPLEISEAVVAAQAFVFYIGGYETSATTLAFMLYQLALNPDIQDKVISEIDEVSRKNGGEITYETLNELKYMEQVFHETLRLYPVVDPLQRRAKVDYKLPGTNLTIKKGTIVLLSVLGVHYDENNYPDPLQFDPERWSPDNSRDRHSCAYLPFGVGPRVCIGMRLARIQVLVGLSKLLSKYRVTPSENTPKTIKFAPAKLLNHPHKGIPLNVIPRDI